MSSLYEPGEENPPLGFRGAEWLVEQGIKSLSLNPDTAIDTWRYLSRITAWRETLPARANAVVSAVARAQ